MNRKDILSRLSKEGGALQIGKLPGMPEAAIKLVENWGDKKVLIQEDKLLAGHLCFDGQPIARVIIGRHNGQAASAHIFIFRDQQKPSNIRSFAKTILANLEHFGMKYS